MAEDSSSRFKLAPRAFWLCNTRSTNGQRSIRNSDDVLTLRLIIVGMLACRLDVQIGFDPNLTALSAIVAVVFTFAAFASPYVSESIEHSKFAQAIAVFFRTLRRWIFSCCPERDVEAGYEQLSAEEDERRSRASQDTDFQREDNDEDEQDVDPYSDDPLGFPARRRPNSGAFYEPEIAPHAPIYAEPPPIAGAVAPDVAQRELLPQRGRLRGPVNMGRSSTHPEARSTTLKSPPLVRQRSLPRPTRSRISSESPGRDIPSTPPSSGSSSDSLALPRPRANSGTGSALSGTTATGSTSGSSGGWGDVRVGLSREARMRIRARAQDKPAPVFGWGYWLDAQWRTVTMLVVVRAAVWGLALVMMHYCGEFLLCVQVKGAR